MPGTCEAYRLSAVVTRSDVGGSGKNLRITKHLSLLFLLPLGESGAHLPLFVTTEEDSNRAPRAKISSGEKGQDRRRGVGNC